MTPQDLQTGKPGHDAGDLTTPPFETSAALVLAAHGATDDPRCAAPVERHAAAIRELGHFPAVITIYWKQPPYFGDLYDMADARELLVVPLMTASGYYTRTVLPREIRLNAPPPDVRVHLARPIGEFDAMADLITAQAIDAATRAAVDPADTRILLIGHGTRRDPVNSGATTYRHARTINTRGGFAGVHVGFLEQDPTVPEAFAAIPGTEPVIIVPYLIASGGHGADDIPGDLNLKAGTRAAVVGGRTALLAEAAGEHPRAADLILQAAQEIADHTRNLGTRRCAG